MVNAGVPTLVFAIQAVVAQVTGSCSCSYRKAWLVKKKKEEKTTAN